AQVIFNPVAQVKFVHTVSAGYVTGSIFVLAISAYYLLRKRHVELAKRSIAVAAAFGLAASLSAVVLGDESGYTASENQKMKVAAIEAEWDTQPAPASFTVVGLPSVKDRKTHFEVKVPYALGIIATRSLDKQVLGINDLVEMAKHRIRNGMIAYDALAKLKKDRTNEGLRNTIEEHGADLGYALLLKRFRPDVQNATAAQIDAAAATTIPDVPVLFWSFRFMVGLGLLFILLFGFSYWLCTRRDVTDKRYRWYLRIAALSLPLPWIASELGWVVAEYGRQPWVIEGVLPTALGVSSTPASNVLFSLLGFIVFYSALAVVDAFLMIKYVRLGPDGTLGHAVASPTTISAAE
ncbi:MAG: cytochrome ubiquinol oxidase subunit I, partial [Rhizomicrobium sp.]